MRTKVPSVNPLSLLLQFYSSNVFMPEVIQTSNLNIYKGIRHLTMLFKKLKRVKCNDQQPSLDHFQIFTCGRAIMYSFPKQSHFVWVTKNVSQQLFVAKNSHSYSSKCVTQCLACCGRRKHCKGNVKKSVFSNTRTFLCSPTEYV